MLQNSDDAASKAVEIHFETRKYLDEKDGAAAGNKEQPSVAKSGTPDLKSTLVSTRFASWIVLADVISRLLGGPSGTTASYSVMRTGVV